MTTVVDDSRVELLSQREESRYITERPKSRELFERAKKSLLGGTPNTWMNVWVGPFVPFVKEAKGAYITDVDGHRYLDVCLGDTGAMFGHSPEAMTKAISDQAGRGLTTMLPSEDSIWVGKELERRFHLPYWQVFMTATDVNRFAINAARELTGRKLIVCMNGTYHGSVAETLVFQIGGVTTHFPGSMGPLLDDPTQMTRVIEFNDVDELEQALSPRDIACVITEPVMTNVGIIYPEPGYLEALRELTRRFGTLLLIDETHSICHGYAGITGDWNLEPDLFCLGKVIAGGFPAAVMGLSKEVGEKLMKRIPWHNFFGFGGTLSGNPLAVAAIRANLEHVMTKEAYDWTIPLAKRMEDSLSKTIKDAALPWYVCRIGCRVEFRFRPTPPKNGGEALGDFDAVDLLEVGFTGPVEKLFHLYFANRGILMTPFHEMSLVSPQMTADDIDLYTKVFAECVNEMVR